MKPLYFIALLPPSPILEEVKALKEYVAEKYNSRVGLRSPPHVTLFPPFRWSLGSEPDLVKVLKAYASAWKQFPVTLKNFGAFPRRTIFIEVEPNPALGSLAKNLGEHLSKELNLVSQDLESRSFRPHMTLATRDLKRQYFNQAWAEFSSRRIEFEFNASSLILFKHNQKFWEILGDFPFQS